MDRRSSGSVAEGKVVTELIECGAVVSQPLYYEARYDVLADFDGDIFRVQIKRAFDSGKENSAKVEARGRNSCGDNPYDETEIDCICVYVPHLDECHWYWINEISNQFNIYIGDWEELSPANKAQMRNPNEYKITERFK